MNIALEQGAELLAAKSTSIDDLSAAGWNLEMNMGGNVYFRHTPTRQVLGLPFWAKQMIDLAKKEAQESTRSAIREALGIE